MVQRFCTTSQRSSRIPSWFPASVLEPSHHPAHVEKRESCPVKTNELWSHSFKEDVPQSSSGLAQLLSQSFLDLFCGDAGVSKKICGSGFGVVSVDTCIDSSLDLCIAA